ncbi:DUF3270 domain-containing protein [Streptococcus constellatus subsp. pharyngis]|uniref:DUF3270 family protein n=1 Tax=Streptococcus constellatus subsp. pharyngis SK1060 = CCUG 46377 TaxID=1035184 RepID=U2ZQE6_STRCV|nr:MULTISPECIES: DUF3270 domain-containing protein [Streptococcus]AGU72885.1 hypothetical protein SCRE_1051 [Streptococcus constellatus subsp. pharyngis C232]AGU74640.1 hypothetical protein SCR2_1051 [Streptococcus constellatus subsp. pharyngis C818]AGU80045.1 hypothetical protein SCI_1110 [Streptococcus constellatus subsp. pharyngis C1050]OFN53694.1 hypothetical protein HMPREF2542_06120 [Streptococcus sp. HMSC034B05]OFP94722.1 hypothetical protein HMPREF2963_08650 [Streptococcus sp. HMSC067A0
MTARKYQSYQEDYAYLEQEQYPLYQDYIPEAKTNPNLKELLFFVNIATFCILTVLFSFLFLSIKVNTFLAFTLAIAVSLVCIKVQQTFIRRKRNK